MKEKIIKQKPAHPKRKLKATDGVVVGFLIGWFGAFIVTTLVDIYIKNIFVNIVVWMFGFIFCWAVLFFVMYKFENKLRRQKCE